MLDAKAAKAPSTASFSLPSGLPRYAASEIALQFVRNRPQHRLHNLQAQPLLVRWSVGRGGLAEQYLHLG